MAFDFELLNAKAADQLRATALLVERAGKPSRRSWTIPFSDLSGSRLDQATDQIALALGKKCRSLYTFRLSDECTPEKVREMVPGYDDWNIRLERERVAIGGALRRQDTATILSILFGRLYVLRNQLVHGGATWACW